LTVNESGNQRRIKITKRLEEFFNVDNTESDRNDTDELQLPLSTNVIPMTVPDSSEFTTQMDIADRIDKALPQVRGLETEDRDLDDYAQQAMDSCGKLMDLGFNMDDRNAGKVFEVASTMMSNAITAKTAKLDKKLKMVELQLKAARLAQTQKPEEEAQNNNGELSTDRNAILNLINQNMKK
jgi:hypothetical protein